MDSKPIIDYAMTRAMVENDSDRVFGYAFAIGFIWANVPDEIKKELLDYVARQTKENN